MNVNDIMTRVKRKFGDESGVQITDADIIRWINDGMQQIVIQNEGLLETTSLASTVADQQQYSLPADLLILKAIQYKDTGQDSYFLLKGMHMPEFNRYIDGWDGGAFVKGVPAAYSVFAGKIIFFPIPDTTITDAIKIYYNRKPTAVATGTDTPELPEMYHKALVKHCLVEAYETDENWDAAQLKQTDRDSDISLLRGRDDWKQQETYPMITVMPEDGW